MILNSKGAKQPPFLQYIHSEQFYAHHFSVQERDISCLLSSQKARQSIEQIAPLSLPTVWKCEWKKKKDVTAKEEVSTTSGDGIKNEFHVATWDFYTAFTGFRVGGQNVVCVLLNTFQHQSARGPLAVLPLKLLRRAKEKPP